MVNRIERSDVLSLRIHHAIIEGLKEEAKVNHVSLNVVANNVLEKYIEWERDAEKAGFMPVSKNMLSSILQIIGDEDIEKIAAQTTNVIKTQIIYMEKRYDLNSFLHWMNRWCRASDFSTKEFYQDDSLVFVIKHELGWKWSVYFEALIKTLLDDFVKGKVDFDRSSSMLIFRIITEQQLGSSVVQSV